MILWVWAILESFSLNCYLFCLHQDGNAAHNKAAAPAVLCHHLSVNFPPVTLYAAPPSHLPDQHIDLTWSPFEECFPHSAEVKKGLTAGYRQQGFGCLGEISARSPRQPAQITPSRGHPVLAFVWPTMGIPGLSVPLDADSNAQSQSRLKRGGPPLKGYENIFVPRKGIKEISGSWGAFFASDKSEPSDAVSLILTACGWRFWVKRGWSTWTSGIQGKFSPTKTPAYRRIPLKNAVWKVCEASQQDFFSAWF